jgi:hypothetical protein
MDEELVLPLVGRHMNLGAYESKVLARVFGCRRNEICNWKIEKSSLGNEELMLCALNVMP